MSNEALTWAFRQVTGSPGRKAVLVALADKADEQHSCWPSQDLLGQMTEQGVRTVRRHLADLETAGFISRGVRRDKLGYRSSDRYVLTVNVAVGVPSGQTGQQAKRPIRPVGQPAKAAGRRPTSTENAPVSPPASLAARRRSQPAKFDSPTGQSGQVTQREPSTTTKTPARPPASTRGTRIDPNWVRSESDRAWQAENDIPDDFARQHTAEFKDFWIAKAGAGGLKLDWSATWRNWMRRAWREHNDRPGRRNPQASTGGVDWMNLPDEHQVGV